MAHTNEPEQKSPILTAGKVFSDGSAIELVRTASDPEKLGLLSWNDQILSAGPRVNHAGREFAPVPIEPSIAEVLRLPSDVAPKETTGELFKATHNLLTHLGQPETAITKLAFAVFASWFPEFLPMLPVLWIVAPEGSLKNLALQLLSQICRRPLVLAGVSRGHLRYLPMTLQPTLIFDEPNLGPAMLSLFRSSSRRGVNIPNGPRIQRLYGSKIIVSHKFPRDTALTSEALRVVLIPSTGRPPLLDENVQEDIAQQFQNRYVGYRLRNFRNVQLPAFDVSRLTPPAQDLARALGAAIVGDEELQGKILPALQGQDEEFRAERSNTTEAVLLEALLFFDHKGETCDIRCLELAKTVDAIRLGRGDVQKPISPESVGWRLKALGIPSGSINSAGHGVKQTDATRRLIHLLALRYDVRALQTGFRAGCRYCEEIKKAVDLKQG